MRSRIARTVVAAAVLAGAGLGWVVAQDAAVPPVQSPPEEAAPPAGNAQPGTDSAGLPTAPVPYSALRPTTPGGERPRPRNPGATRPGGTPEGELAPGELAPTAKRPRHPGAIIQAVDKVTAETLRFEAKVGRPVRYKTLVLTLRACETEAADELIRESAAHVTVTSQPKAQPGRVQPEPAQVFRGWMFASSPGLNPFEHPVYDVWLVACTPSPTAVQPPAPVQPAPPVQSPPRTQAGLPANAPG